MGGDGEPTGGPDRGGDDDDVSELDDDAGHAPDADERLDAQRAFWARWRHRPRQELQALAIRSREILLVAAVTGVVVGFAVAFFEYLTVEVLLHTLEEADVWVVAVVPVVGLALTALLLRYAGPDLSPSNADEYLKAFHQPTYRLQLRAMVVRTIGAITTLGSGVPLGFEGPSMYLGATVGGSFQRRVRNLFRGSDRRLLIVCGAAAGVAAIFKAPATGAVFAIESPYHNDTAHRLLLPASIAGAAGYLAFVVVNGTEPLIPVQGTPPLSAVDIVGAVAVGVAGGVLARLFALAIRNAKDWHSRTTARVRLLIGGGTLAGTILLGFWLTDEPVMIGPGFGAVRWALSPELGLWVLLAVLALRCIATICSVSGGGVGGLFVPLVVTGALLGRFMGGAFGELDNTLFLVIGVAAVLSAGYRVPLAAIIFVAETTGRPGFVVPGLLAAVTAELMMGKSSVTNYQIRRDPIVRPGETP